MPTATLPNFEASGFDVTELLEDLVEDFRSQMWSQASLHEAAEDLVHCADLFWVRRELGRYTKNGDLDLFGLNE